MIPSFYEIFSFLDLPDINIVDVGASPIDGKPPYQSLKDINRARIYGFEPNIEQYQHLLEQITEKETFFPHALGDGNLATLNFYKAPGMTSLLKPDYQILDYFHGFSEWAEIVGQEVMQTHRLDDIEEITTIDYIKLDVQGGEMDIIQNGKNKISSALVIHTEVNFIPFYEGQALFAELDQILRELGFYLHTFMPLKNRSFKPLIVDDSIYSGINQVLWTDAIYVKKFTDFSQLSSENLVKIAIIMHDLYKSYDLSLLALQKLDQKEKLDFCEVYSNSLSKKE
jgi:FkbM family methyltransferase